MNTDQVKGHLNEAQGKVKEVTGKLIGSTKLELKGKVQKTLGKVLAVRGDIKENFKKLG